MSEVTTTGAPVIVDERTGEMYPLADAPTDVLALALRSVELRLRDLYEFKRVVGGEVIARMDKNLTWTLRAEGVEVTAPSPKAGQDSYDPVVLVPILDELVEEGAISREAARAACEPRTEWRVLIRGVNALLKVDGMAERIQPAKVSAVADKPRTVKVSPNRGAS